MISLSLLSLKRTMSFWDEDALDADYDRSERSSKRPRNVSVFFSQAAVPPQGAREGTRDDSEDCTRADNHDNEARCLQEASMIQYNVETNSTTAADGISSQGQFDKLHDPAPFHHSAITSKQGQEKSSSERVAAPSQFRLSHDATGGIGNKITITSSTKHEEVGELKKDVGVHQLRSMFKRASFKSAMAMRPVANKGLISNQVPARRKTIIITRAA
jgi:hypothetical protein